MELKYCDRCGNPMNVDAAKQDMSDEFVCPDCLDQAADKACSSSGSQLRIVDSPPPRTVRDEFDSGLDLFSQNTVAMKKSAMSEPKKPRSKKPEPPPAEEDAPQLPDPDASLELFSPQTLLLKKLKPKEQEDDALSSLETQSGSVYLSDPNGLGAAAPAPTATHIQLRCVHCRKRLVIRPVHKASKVVCPGCSKKMDISASNRVSKSPAKRPEHESTTVTGDTMIAKLDPADGKHDTPTSSLSGATSLSSLVKKPNDTPSPEAPAAAATAATQQEAPPVATATKKPEPVAEAGSASGLEVNASSDSGSTGVDNVVDDLAGNLGADLDFNPGESAPASSTPPQSSEDAPLVGGQFALGLDASGPDEPSPQSLRTTADMPTDPTGVRSASGRLGRPAQRLTFRKCFVAVCIGLMLSLPFFTAAYLTHLQHDRQNVEATAQPDSLAENLRALGVAVRDGFKRLLGNQ